MNRRSLFRRLLAVCAAPLLKRLPGREVVEPPVPQWKNWTFKYEDPGDPAVPYVGVIRTPDFVASDFFPEPGDA